jgi:hypothetical protein
MCLPTVLIRRKFPYATSSIRAVGPIQPLVQWMLLFMSMWRGYVSELRPPTGLLLIPRYGALKAKAVPLHAMKTLGGRGRTAYLFSTSTLDGGELSASRPGRALLPGKEPPVPFVQEAGWAPEPVSDIEATGKILSPLPGIEPRSPGRPARSQTLYWLSHPAHKYGALVEGYWQGKTKYLWTNSVPLPRRPPQIPHTSTLARTRASEVRDWRLTAWVMARPWGKVSCVIFCTRFSAFGRK